MSLSRAWTAVQMQAKYVRASFSLVGGIKWGGACEMRVCTVIIPYLWRAGQLRRYVFDCHGRQRARILRSDVSIRVWPLELSDGGFERPLTRR